MLDGLAGVLTMKFITSCARDVAVALRVVAGQLGDAEQPAQPLSAAASDCGSSEVW